MSKCKGQIVWNGFLVSSVSSKNERKQVDLRYSKVEFFRSLFGGNRRHQKPFRNYLTFSRYFTKTDRKRLEDVDGEVTVEKSENTCFMSLNH